MINRVVLVGRLTRDPELRKTTSEKSVCSFTVAIDNRGKKDENAKASFISCVAFNQTAETMCKFCRKGNLVGVEGRLCQRSFVRQDGNKGSVLEVLCDSVQFLQPKSGDIANEEPNNPPYDDVEPVEDNSEKNLNSLDDVLESEKLPF